LTPPEGTVEPRTDEPGGVEPGGAVAGRFQPVLERFARVREGIERRRWTNVLYRVAIGVVGAAIVVVGIFMLPAPGPGWVVIFAGLGVLATEFAAARRLLAFTRRKYLEWIAWMGRQSPPARVLISLAILAMLAGFAWLFGVFELVGGWLGIEWSWLGSPLR
jgi:uncharacterized protein (TIGR02611 family)